MRFKLILLTSLIAAIVGVLSIGLLILGGLGSIDYAPESPAFNSFHWIELLWFLPLFLTALFAGIFVYRHTAIRRKLQASITAALVSVYYLAAIILLKLTLG